MPDVRGAAGSALDAALAPRTRRDAPPRPGALPTARTHRVHHQLGSELQVLAALAVEHVLASHLLSVDLCEVC